MIGSKRPASITTPMLDFRLDGETNRLQVGGGVNLVAAGAILVTTAVLMRGVTQSFAFNTAVVLLKIAALVAFVLVGVAFVEPANLTPFVPPAM
mgnify:CR=1 FL=1